MSCCDTAGASGTLDLREIIEKLPFRDGLELLKHIRWDILPVPTRLPAASISEDQNAVHLVILPDHPFFR